MDLELESDPPMAKIASSSSSYLNEAAGTSMVSRRPAKMTTGGDDDRLSELSDDLLRRILYFVSSNEAARTSVLSRRWGSLWRSSGAVNLAAHVQGFPYDDGFYDDKEAEAEKAFFSKRDAFVRGAKAALDAAEVPIARLTLRVEPSNPNDDHYSGSTIRRFLNCRMDWHTGTDVVDAVVSHQAARHVEELRVAAADVSDYFENESSGYGESGICYWLTSLPSSEALRVLDLTGCDLNAAALPLPRLATLRLRFCSVELQLLRALLDAAPELTTVQLESVFFGYVEASEPPVVHLSFQAASTLVLALCGMEVRDDPHGRWAIEIDAPRLQSFTYKGNIRPFILRSVAPSIAMVDLYFLRQEPNPYHPRPNYEPDPDPYGLGDSDDLKETRRVLFWQFLHEFTNARNLKLKVGNDLKDVAAIGEPAKRAWLLCAFPRAEHLELEGTHAPNSKTAAVAIANLLHCCPVLGEIVLKLSAASATAPRHRDSQYGREFLERKDRSDYTKSMKQFVDRQKSKKIVSTEDCIFGDSKCKYSDVPGIPGLSGRSFACLQHTVRRVGLHFTLDNNSNSSSSCLGLRLIKFFADHARVLEEMCIDTGNMRLYEHLKFNVETQMALAPVPISATASINYKNPAESLSALDFITDLAKSTASFTVLPLQRQERMDCKP